MKATENNLGYIFREIKAIHHSDKIFGNYIERSKNYWVEYYIENKNRVNELEKQRIFDFDFVKQVYKYAEELHLIDRSFKLIIKSLEFIEVHNYAPELNKAYFKGGHKVNCPNVFNNVQLLDFMRKKFTATELFNMILAWK